MNQPHPAPSALPLPISSRPLIWLAGAWLAFVLAMRIGAIWADYDTARDLFLLQDRALLLAQLALAGIALLPWERWRLPWPRRDGARPWVLSGRGVAVLALAVALAGWAGHYALLMGYDLSRDEQMAVFDARIYAAGRLVWPLPAPWQGDSAALNLLFMLPVARPVAWVSTYLPGNSLLRVMVGLVADPALTGGLLSGGAVALVWSCARKLWPGETPAAREAATISAVLLALSGQVVMAGMTAYAMPAHMFFNLLWLRLFLADRRRADVAALAVAFVATGLHQPLFHPLFAAPWLALVVWDKRWGRAALYALPYAAIGAFWLAWPHITHGLVAGPHSATDVGTGYAGRLLDVLTQNTGNLALMAANLLRFCTWQQVVMVPLIMAGLCAARHDRHALAAALSFLLPVALMALILPYQGHGFGYRYLHPALGAGALLAGWGWRWLAPWQAALRPRLARATLLGALLLLPLQAGLAHAIYAAFAQVNARLAATQVDYLIIGGDDAPYALDFVLNRPDLSNRPLRLSATDIDDIDALAAHICVGHKRVGLPSSRFYAPVWRYFGVAPTTTAAQRERDLAPALTAAGCRVAILS